MAVDKGKTKNPQVSHSWGILLSLATLPILALAAKLLPSQIVIWEVLGGIFLLLATRSLWRFLSTDPAQSRKGERALGEHAH